MAKLNPQFWDGKIFPKFWWDGKIFSPFLWDHSPCQPQFLIFLFPFSFFHPNPFFLVKLHLLKCHHPIPKRWNSVGIPRKNTQIHHEEPSQGRVERGPTAHVRQVGLVVDSQEGKVLALEKENWDQGRREELQEKKKSHMEKVVFPGKWWENPMGNGGTWWMLKGFF